MTASWLIRFLLPLCALLSTASCMVGGGGSPTAGGGIGGTGAPVAGVASGEITEFGSIIVNGATYDISGATVTVDGAPGVQTALKLGMVVDVRFQLSGGRRVATSVVQEDVAEGQVLETDLVVESQAPLIAHLFVLKQKVLISEQTNFFDQEGRGSDFSALQDTLDAATGPVVIEVSGHVVGSGMIDATYIKINTPPATTVLRGIVQDHMPATSQAGTFKIGDLVITYDKNTTISKMPDPPWDGLLVQVLGDRIGSAGELVAKKVEPKKLEAKDGDLAEIEGFVTEVTRDAQGDVVEFVVEDTQVIVTDDTLFEGCEREDIDVGAKVEADGVFDEVNGVLVLVANVVKCKDNVRLVSDIDSIDLSTGTITLKGLDGVTVLVTSDTKLQAQGPDKPDDLTDFNVGDPVRVFGREVSPGDTVLTRRIQKRSNPPSHVLLQGPVDAASDPNVTILNIIVDTSGPFVFRDVDETEISRAVFFGSVGQGTIVKLKGTLDGGGTVTWTEAQLED